jgi:D-glycero-alpha-D-manno-heptose-7-phosphate kinase
LAGASTRLEIDLRGEGIGKQDQYAAAFGGLNFIEFHQDYAVSVHPIV